MIPCAPLRFYEPRFDHFAGNRKMIQAARILKREKPSHKDDRFELVAQLQKDTGLSKAAAKAAVRDHFERHPRLEVTR